MRAIFPLYQSAAALYVYRVRVWVPLKYSVLHPYWVFEYLRLVGKGPIVFIVGRLYQYQDRG